MDRGWGDDALAKLAGGNVIRVFRDVEKVARRLKRRALKEA
jgi:membrane dipeptidase